ncbi:MAG TPA: AlkA N-terminal domain-containing protein [Candidatus Binatia bacterium]|nr:AlkA N-terminal domain-containing protein [Candidatus Binatia bacterium]
MELADSVCYRALATRDARFDGRFFVAVRTSGIYCRPICPARTPKRENVTFFPCAAAAEAAGFRPCLRCRPETSPGTPAWNGTSAVVSRALRLIEDGASDGGKVLAARVGLGERQLRRLFQRHLGASPAEIARARRLHFAKRLIDETTLGMTEAAISAGFRSVRQFNHSIRQTFDRSPRELRRRQATKASSTRAALALRLSYRPPFEWHALLRFFGARATPGIEVVDGDSYRRTIVWGGMPGWIEVSAAEHGTHLVLRAGLPTVQGLIQLAERVRRIFDLNADPLPVIGVLSRDPYLRAPVRARPGLRVPGAWDAFEIAVRAILGQQVTVRAATTLAGRLVQRFGRAVECSLRGLTHLFPAPQVLADADLDGIGLTRSRAETIRSLARAVAAGTLRFDASRGLEETVARLTALPGIGEWTAHYIAMRAFGEPDAFPAGDLGLRRALANGNGMPSTRTVSRIAEAWRPWRAYAVVHLWTSESAKQTRS